MYHWLLFKRYTRKNYLIDWLKKECSFPVTPVQKCYTSTKMCNTSANYKVITWPYRGLGYRTHRGQVFSWSWLLTRSLVFHMIAGSGILKLWRISNTCKALLLCLAKKSFENLVECYGLITSSTNFRENSATKTNARFLFAIRSLLLSAIFFHV